MTPFLYLPAHYVSSSNTSAGSKREFLGTHIGRREIAGDPGDLTQLIEKLSKLNCERVLSSATFIGSLFDYRHKHSSQEQLGIAERVLPGELLQKLKTRWQDVAKRHEVVFHRQQLWVVIQLAIICCPNTIVEPSDESDEEHIRALGECLLIANDVVGDQLTRRFKEDKNAQSPEWFMSASFLSMIELNWQATGPVCPSRAISIWSDILSTERNQKAIDRLLGELAPEDAFQEVHGVSLTKYLDFVATLHFLFHDQNEKKKPLQIQRDVLALLGDNDYIDRCLNLLTRTPEQLASDLIFRPRQSWAVDFSPLRQHPVIRLKNDRFVCPDLQLLEYYFDDALYWSIVDAYPQNSEIQQFYGELFEQHVNQVIASFADHGPLLARQFLPSPKFEGDNAQVSDCVLDWSEVLAIVEYKASRLTRYQKYSGDVDAMLKGIDDAYTKNKSGDKKGIAQLARSANRILNGTKVVGTLPIGSRLLLPILIITEPGLTTELIRRRLDVKLQNLIEEGHRSRVLPLILISQFDIEAFESYIGEASAEKILRSYADSIRTKDANLLDSFSTYVFRNYGDVVPAEPIYMQQLRAQQLHEIAKRYGIPNDSKDHDAK